MARLFLVLLLLGATAEARSGIPFRPRGIDEEGSQSPEEYWYKNLPSTSIPSSLRSLLLADNKNAIPAFLFFWGPINVNVTRPGGGVRVTLPNFNYQYAATQTQVRDNANTTIFFLEKDLLLGSKFHVLFSGASTGAKFLPRSVADSVPFSSAKLAETLALFGVSPDSAKAKIVSKTLARCEEKPVAGETSHCATSLESLVDISTSSLGSHDLAAVSTVITNGKPVQQVYTVEPNGVKELGVGGVVACHPEEYPYAVFYCHSSRATRAYLVSLAGSAGTKVEAVVACHTDTSGWNPKHLAFQLLKVKPGTVPVCHFLPSDHVVFTQSCPRGCHGNR